MSTGTVTRHLMPGLRAEPLASYLAGLGLIRLLGEQADAAATVAWSPDGLVIGTIVEDMASWLADEYMPTPVLSPWNNGSGFGAKDKEPKRTLEAMQEHPSARLGPLRDAITVAEQVSALGRAKGWVADGDNSGDKGRIVQEFRNRCPDSLLPWIDAAVVLTDDSTLFPPLLGTGGNDGRLDFSTNFHQRLLEVLDPADQARARSLAWARDLLAGTQDRPLASAAVGQFDPGAAGGPGSSRFGAADSLVNPWGYILLVEGALLFAASAVRRYQHGGRRAAIPFTVRESPDGSASGADGEMSRGEVWAPVWRQEFTLPEVRQLFGEARASWRGRPARQAVEFYAATRTLGVTAGVDEFVRYGLHRRNGLAFAAVPVDRVNVHAEPAVSLAGQVEDWVTRVHGAGAPASASRAVRQFDRAHLNFARDGDALGLARLLAAITTLEQAVGRSGRTRDKVPVRRLPPAEGFVAVLAARECPEMRVAVGLASSATLRGADPVRSPARALRQILLPVDPHVAGRDRDGQWRDSPLVPGFGMRPLEQVLADVLAWRCRTAADEQSRQVFRGVPTFRSGVPVPAADLHALARGQLDDVALDLWLRACLALDWRGVRRVWQSAGPPLIPVPALGLLHPLAAGLAPKAPTREDRSPTQATTARNAAMPAPLRAGTDMPRLALRPDWAARLAAGQVPAIHQEAATRLRQAGWGAVRAMSPAGGTALASQGTLIAAALLPRCQGWPAVLSMLATRIRDEEEPGSSGPDGHALPDESAVTDPA
jgi:CRISPR-associated protein Csx17